MNVQESVTPSVVVGEHVLEGLLIEPIKESVGSPDTNPAAPPAKIKSRLEGLLLVTVKVTSNESQPPYK
jgi:hypothetical protein